MVVSHMKGIDRQINEEIMPQIENQLQDMIFRLVKQNKLHRGDSSSEGRPAVFEAEAQSQIKQIIVEEFATAMDLAIKPMLQEQFEHILLDVSRSLQFVNDDFAERLR